MTVTPAEVETLYQYYKQTDRAFAEVCAEQVPPNDPEAMADHVRRFEEARHHRSDAKYAWERAHALSLQPQT